MPKLTIEVTEKAHSVLKERAKSEERSLTQYITLLLDDITGVRHLLTTSTTYSQPVPVSDTTSTTKSILDTLSLDTKPVEALRPVRKTLISDPSISSIPNNKYYNKILTSYQNAHALERFNDLIAHANTHDIKYIKDYHSLDIYDALGIPHTHTLTNTEWEEIVEYLTGEKADE